MKKSISVALPVAVALLISSLLFSSCQSSITPGYSSNNDVINYTDFYLNAENVSLNTSVRGTIYIRGDADKTENRHVQITAWMEIDADDWGGVGFLLPPEWKVTNIVSDYPQGNPKPESYITILHTGADEEYDTNIIIGGTKYGAPEVQGGTGNIIIEAEPESKDTVLPDMFKVIIGVGSQYDYIVHPVHETFETPLKQDYRDVSPYTIHPSPGNYLTDNDFNKSGLALKDVRAEKVTADMEYIIPSDPEQTVKKGDTILLITGHVQNMDKGKFEVILWAEGYGSSGKQTAWSLKSALIPSRIDGHIEYQQTGDFAMYVNITDDLETIRIFGVNYLVPPPVVQNQDEVTVPDAEPVVYERALYMMGGAKNELYIYGDGTVIYIEEKGLRFPSPERPAVRTVHAGALTGEQLETLLEYINTSGMDKLDEYYYYRTEPEKNGSFSLSDMELTVLVNNDGMLKTVKAFGYISTDQGETYPGMPAPLDEIWVKLRAIAMSASEVYQENIAE